MTKQPDWLRRGLVALSFAVLAVSGPTVADSSRRCVQADTAWPIVLPDGSSHPPGSLRICFADRLSPVAGLHDTYVNGRPVGIFVSRVGSGEALLEDAEPILQFTETEQGYWVLEAYAIPTGDRMVTYKLDKEPALRRFGAPLVAGRGNRVLLADVSN